MQEVKPPFPAVLWRHVFVILRAPITTCVSHIESRRNDVTYVRHIESRHNDVTYVRHIESRHNDVTNVRHIESRHNDVCASY